MRKRQQLTPDVLRGLSVLVVEDSRFMRDMVRDILRQMGVGEIHLAENGKHALEVLETKTVDVIFADWEMPVMDGVEMTLHIRRGPNSRFPEIPVIFVTGRVQTTDVIAARNAGVTEFIAKPMTPAHLEHRLQAVLFDQRPFVRRKDYVGPDRRRRWAHDHKGELRRSSDPGKQETAAPAPNDPAAATREDMSAQLSALSKLVAGFDGESAEQTGAIIDAAAAFAASAEKAGDAEIAAAAASLEHYLKAHVARGAAEREVVFMHISSISRLIELMGGDAGLRAQVAAGLKSVVAKKTRRAAS